MGGNHTPGPWKKSSIMEGDGEFIEISDQEGRLIADVWFDRKHEEPTCPPLEEAEANANLILAAPDLLKQLKNAKNMLEKYQGTVEYFEICQAIKKAEGREHENRIPRRPNCSRKLKSLSLQNSGISSTERQLKRKSRW